MMKREISSPQHPIFFCDYQQQRNPKEWSKKNLARDPPAKRLAIIDIYILISRKRVI
jgi:hypothetical protein